MKKIRILALLCAVFIGVHQVIGQTPDYYEIVDGEGLSDSQLRRNAIDWLLTYQVRSDSVNKKIVTLRALTQKYPIVEARIDKTHIIQSSYAVDNGGVTIAFVISIEIKEGRVLIILDNIQHTQTALQATEFSQLGEYPDWSTITGNKKVMVKRFDERFQPNLDAFILGRYLPSFRKHIVRKPYEIQGWD